MDSFTWADLMAAVQACLDTAWNWVVQVVKWVQSWLKFLHNVANYIWNALVWVTQKIWAGFHWLTNLNFSSIWKWIKKVHDRYVRFRKWWQENIQKPIDDMRKQILAIYRQYFKPIIDVIETLRVGVRIIAVFNRKLAAKLDAKLWQLEGWILTPITAAIRRINGMASIVYAILTATGRFDATVFIATVHRHITEIRAALLGLPFKNDNLPVDDRPARNAATALDFHNWCQSGGGPIQDGVDAMTSEFQEAYTMIGSFHG